MSQQHQKWLDLVKERMDQKGWNRSDLAQVAGVSPAMVTRLLNEGHGSDELKKHISDKLGIREPWELFEGSWAQKNHCGNSGLRILTKVIIPQKGKFGYAKSRISIQAS